MCAHMTQLISHNSYSWILKFLGAFTPPETLFHHSCTKGIMFPPNFPQSNPLNAQKMVKDKRGLWDFQTSHKIQQMHMVSNLGRETAQKEHFSFIQFYNSTVLVRSWCKTSLSLFFFTKQLVELYPAQHILLPLRSMFPLQRVPRSMEWPQNSLPWRTATAHQAVGSLSSRLSCMQSFSI